MRTTYSPVKQTLHIPIILQEEPEGGFTVIVPLLPGCVTYGKTLKKAKHMAQEAIELYLEDMVEDGEPIPSFTEAYMGEVEIAFPRMV